MRPLQILYVDDDPDIRAIATMSLSLDPDVSVRSAASGEEALALLAAEPGWVPDAILLDVMMPGMDGPELARLIRDIPALSRVPLLFMTARARDNDVQDYLALGAVSVITKPFDPLALAGQVRRQIAGA